MIDSNANHSDSIVCVNPLLCLLLSSFLHKTTHNSLQRDFGHFGVTCSGEKNEIKQTADNHLYSSSVGTVKSKS